MKSFLYDVQQHFTDFEQACFDNHVMLQDSPTVYLHALQALLVEQQSPEKAIASTIQYHRLSLTNQFVANWQANLTDVIRGVKSHCPLNVIQMISWVQGLGYQQVLITVQNKTYIEIPHELLTYPISGLSFDLRLKLIVNIANDYLGGVLHTNVSDSTRWYGVQQVHLQQLFSLVTQWLKQYFGSLPTETTRLIVAVYTSPAEVKLKGLLFELP